MARRPPVSRLQEQEQRRRDTRANPLETALASWLRRYAELKQREVLAQLRNTGELLGVAFGKSIRKADATPAELEAELRRLLTRFGLQQIEESGSKWAASVGGSFVARPSLQEEYAHEVENKVQLIFRDTERMVRDSLRSIIVDAVSRKERPTATDVGRRIAMKWTGDPDDPSAVFGPSRARNIARTELGDADTAGALEGMRSVGVEKVAWGARRNDGKSGERKHYLMNDHSPLSVEGLSGQDRSLWFKLPSGARGRRPLDPALPVGERVNCRCFLYPV